VSISVAMATHNGARYLHDQLESIGRQTLQPDELVISDDASTDETVPIAEDFAATAPFPVHVQGQEPAVGTAENFVRAATSCRSDLVAFSDQDDVWAEQKLARCVRFFDDPGVQLVVHGWTVVDDELREQEVVVPKRRTVEALRAPKWGQAPGMAMVFRRSLLDVLDWGRRPPSHEEGRPLLHDEWVYGLARVVGRIAFLDESLCLYRQHRGNVEGAPERTLRRRAGLTFSLGGQYYERRATQAEAWASLLSELAPGEAASYARLARGLRARCAVYRDRRRGRALFHAVRAGSYGNRKREGFGLRGLARDATLIVLGRR
jgi:glycosyltransferase involved in cell wall biosynthesis